MITQKCKILELRRFAHLGIYFKNNLSVRFEQWRWNFSVWWCRSKMRQDQGIISIVDCGLWKKISFHCNFVLNWLRVKLYKCHLYPNLAMFKISRVQREHCIFWLKNLYIHILFNLTSFFYFFRYVLTFLIQSGIDFEATLFKTVTQFIRHIFDSF